MREEHSDSYLLKLFHEEGKKEFSFSLILKKYQERIYWHIRKMVISHDVTDDIMQDTFLKAWAGLNSFRGESSLFTWLYRIATNETLTYLKKKKRRYFASIDDEEKNITESLEEDIYFNGDEAQLLLQKAVLTLPEKQRIVFNMKYFDDMKYEEISKILNISVGSLKASYHHAVKKIEKFIETG